MLTKQAVKYFQKVYKSDQFRGVILERTAECIYVMDGYIVYPTQETDPLFNSRDMFPKLPEIGQCIKYTKGGNVEERQSVLHIVQQHFNSSKPVVATPILYKQSNDSLLVTYLNEDNTFAFIDSDIHATIPEGVTAFYNNGSWKDPIVFETAGHKALIMPVRADLAEDKIRALLAGN